MWSALCPNEAHGEHFILSSKRMKNTFVSPRALLSFILLCEGCLYFAFCITNLPQEMWPGQRTKEEPARGLTMSEKPPKSRASSRQALEGSGRAPRGLAEYNGLTVHTHRMVPGVCTARHLQGEAGRSIPGGQQSGELLSVPLRLPPPRAEVLKATWGAWVVEGESLFLPFQRHTSGGMSTMANRTRREHPTEAPFVLGHLSTAAILVPHYP
ncbi:hypothetical protein NDU88_010801 [Pleurodeles waltl]|uniref:Uncharacterized protein n=1 Tax=Pleurodeles waltl TaxID=8319 RepID=A0AAV7PVX6_PLEWA|nr:hypothetical protein NDU88_010801 [Pleurodeles waltl]